MPERVDALYADCERSLAKTGTAQLEPLRNSTLLITGGTGFVGLWLSVFAAYLNDRYNFGLEIISTARHAARLADKANFLQKRADFRFIPVDIRQFIDIPPNLKWLIHAAGVPDSRHHASNPIETMSVIAHGTERICQLADRAVDLRAILHFSSALVYGAQPANIAALAETHIGAVNPLNVTNCYAEAKRFSETLCTAFRTQTRLPVVISRPFTFMGPFQPLDAPWAANNFLYAAMEGQPIKILGSGESLRTYLYGSDMALLALHQLVAGQIGAVYNLGHTEAISLRDLAELIVRQSGRAIEIRFNTGGRTVGISRLVPDMNKSVTEFKFAPAFTIADSVARTLKWYDTEDRRKKAFI
jgi:nucleoside-diphosphate-sugar epimerase